MKRPAILGGPPAFPEPLPFARPFTPPLADVVCRLEPSYERGMLTNGSLVEDQAARRLGMDHVVAVSSCTTGLMLTLQALDPCGPGLLPIFTFSASAHAIAWNGLRPMFRVRPVLVPGRHRPPRRAGPRRRSHSRHPRVRGAVRHRAPGSAGRSAGIPLVFDAAHALGASRDGRPVGRFGAAEVFSLSPTKLVVGGEGGLVATADAALDERLRTARDYDNPGDYDTRFVGLNGRMSELHAAVALASLDLLDEHLRRRRSLAERYRDGLAQVPGIALQLVNANDRSTFKDFTVAVDPAGFGLSRDALVQALWAEGIDARCYFFPPVHRQQAYAHLEPAHLPVTDDVAGRVVSLPLFARLAPAAVDQTVEALVALHEHADEADAVAVT